MAAFNVRAFNFHVSFFSSFPHVSIKYVSVFVFVCECVHIQ